MFVYLPFCLFVCFCCLSVCLSYLMHLSFRLLLFYGQFVLVDIDIISFKLDMCLFWDSFFPRRISSPPLWKYLEFITLKEDFKAFPAFYVIFFPTSNFFPKTSTPPRVILKLILIWKEVNKVNYTLHLFTNIYWTYKLSFAIGTR